jgi:DNA-binding transcriptional MerR regulator
MGKSKMQAGYFSHSEAAQQIGITKTTLFLWEKQNKIDKAKRDRNNYRVFTADDIAKIKAFKDRITDPA